jgi:hypothetical protein
VAWCQVSPLIDDPRHATSVADRAMIDVISIHDAAALFAGVGDLPTAFR